MGETCSAAGGGGGECTNLLGAAPRSAKVPSTKTGAKKCLQIMSPIDNMICICIQNVSIFSAGVRLRCRRGGGGGGASPWPPVLVQLPAYTKNWASCGDDWGGNRAAGGGGGECTNLLAAALRPTIALTSKTGTKTRAKQGPQTGGPPPSPTGPEDYQRSCLWPYAGVMISPVTVNVLRLQASARGHARALDQVLPDGHMHTPWPSWQRICHGHAN